MLESSANVPQSLSKVHIHLVFSTKHRERSLPDDIRPGLHAYMGGILKGLGCTPIEINTEPDHAHTLFLLSRTVPLSEVVGHFKKSSNDWLRMQGPQFAEFFWQGGYRAKTFQDELRALLKVHDVEYDERYVWD
ncbi:MAG: transposase [Acidobacteriota bacterium]